MMLTCFESPCDGQQYPGRTTRDWKTHHVTYHGPDVVRFAELGVGQDAHARAMAEVARFAATGQEFCLWQVFEAIGDLDNHKTANGKFAAEISHLNLAHITRYGPSKRPGSNGSAVAYWRGGPKPTKEAAA